MPTVKDAFYVAHPEALAMLRISKRDWKAAAAMTDIEVFEEVTWGFHCSRRLRKLSKAGFMASAKRMIRSPTLPFNSATK